MANIDLLSIRTRIESGMRSYGSQFNQYVVESARRSAYDLNAWWSKWDQVIGEEFFIAISMFLHRY